MSGRLGLIALLALAVLAFLVIVAQPAAAFGTYVHGTIAVGDCSACHPGGDTGILPPNSACTASGCHSSSTAGVQPFHALGGRTCYSCHYPGKDMSSVQTDPGCGTGAAGTACHNTGAAPPHLGSNLKGCTSCHGVVVDFSNPDGSAHHQTTVFTAPTCTDCHKVGGVAVAPHTPYTNEACSVCHVGMTPTHPTLAAMDTATLTATANPLAVTTAGGTTVVSGNLKDADDATPISGATVILQAAATGTTTFTQVGASTTTDASGNFAFPAVAPNGNTTYRAIAHGIVASAKTYLPAKGTVDVTAPAGNVKPVLTIALSKTSILLGKSITVKGTIKPTHAVKVKIQRKVSGSWKTLTTKTATVTVGATSTTYKALYKPLKRGTYRAQAFSPASTGFLKAVSVWKTFKVT